MNASTPFEIASIEDARTALASMEEWMGKTVQYVDGKVRLDAPVESTVVDVMRDEKGNLHCNMANGTWKPANVLAVVEKRFQ